MENLNTHIYFVRHGQVHNPHDIFYGRLPRIRLKTEGIEELEETASYLKSKNISHIFTSPLLRAKQTAKVLQETLQLPTISISKNLIEGDSYLEGKPFTFGKQNRFDHYFTPESKESIQDVADRMMKFVNGIRQHYANKSIVAISHGDPLMILKATINRQPLSLDVVRPGRDLYIKYCEVLALTIQSDGEMQMTSVYRPPRY